MIEKAIPIGNSKPVKINELSNIKGYRYLLVILGVYDPNGRNDLTPTLSFSNGDGQISLLDYHDSKTGSTRVWNYIYIVTPATSVIDLKTSSPLDWQYVYGFK